MKKKLFIIGGVLIVLFVLLQVFFISIYKENLVIEIGTHIEVLDSLKIECFIDDKLVVDTVVYNESSLLIPLKITKRKHSLFFIVNGNKSNILFFNNYLFTLINVEYIEYPLFENEKKQHFLIKIQKHPIRFIM